MWQFCLNEKKNKNKKTNFIQKRNLNSNDLLQCGLIRKASVNFYTSIVFWTMASLIKCFWDLPSRRAVLITVRLVHSFFSHFFLLAFTVNLLQTTPPHNSSFNEKKNEIAVIVMPLSEVFCLPGKRPSNPAGRRRDKYRNFLEIRRRVSFSLCETYD